MRSTCWAKCTAALHHPGVQRHRVRRQAESCLKTSCSLRCRTPSRKPKEARLRFGTGQFCREQAAHPAAPRTKCTLPAPLPRGEKVVDVNSTACPCYAGTLHRVGENVSQRLDVMPAQFQVLVPPPEVCLPGLHRPGRRGVGAGCLVYPYRYLADIITRIVKAIPTTTMTSSLGHATTDLKPVACERPSVKSAWNAEDRQGYSPTSWRRPRPKRAR